MIKKLGWIGILALFSACASPTVVEVVTPVDEVLTCEQLIDAYAETRRFKREAEEEKGLTGGNTARALFFWPAILGTYINSNEAIQAADSRAVHLRNIMRNKKCENVENL